MTPNVEDNTFEQLHIDMAKNDHTIKKSYHKKYRWFNIYFFIVIHVFALYGLIFKLHQMKLMTFIYTFILFIWGALGETAGVHRLWSHRSYKAKWPLRLFLLLGYSTTSQITVHKWVEMHRVHHKYSDTDLDPHNFRRGFFFAHIGWLTLYDTPEVYQKRKEVDMSDIEKDSFVMFQTRYFYAISTVLTIFTVLIPILLWKEDPFISFLGPVALKFVALLHIILSVNSIAHWCGSRPYNKRILPAERGILSFFSLGEGWHNYHHTFPWDYKAAEFGDRLNLTARFLDLCAKLGLAYELKTASPESIARTKEKHGDGSNAN